MQLAKHMVTGKVKCLNLINTKRGGSRQSVPQEEPPVSICTCVNKMLYFPKLTLVWCPYQF